jgi:hypothetical protein
VCVDPLAVLKDETLLLRDGDSWGCGGEDLNDDAILCNGDELGVADCSSSNGCKDDGGFETTALGKRL